jgi:hypothetical protein
VFLAIELSDEVDPTALATVVLALATLVALWFTRRALKQTQQGIDLSRREVEEAHRPVLVPVVDQTREMSLPAATSDRLPAMPTVPGNRFLVPVENIGSGPALGVEATLTLDSDTLPEAHRKGHTIDVPGIGINNLTSLEFPLAGAVLAPFALRLGYRDVAGKKWETTARYANRPAATGGRSARI